VSAFNGADARHVIIGGFAVIAHRHVRATEDVDLLIPDDADNDALVLGALASLGASQMDGREVTLRHVSERPHLRVDCGKHGLVDLLREGEAPLDFRSVLDASIQAEIRGVPMRFAGLESLVVLKRLAGRPRDRQDLEALEEIHGPLPLAPAPGLDTP